MPGLVETKLLTSSLLNALIERRISALRMPHFLSLAETLSVSNRIREIGIEFYVGDTKGGTSERKGMIGPNLFRFKDDLHEYFERTFDFDENIKPILFRDVDVVGRFASLMQSALNAGALFQRARSDRMQTCLSECTVRSLPAAPPHTEWIKAEMEDFDAVGSLTDQFAWNVYISTGESGGHTAIYNTEDRCAIRTGLAPDVLVGPKPGDLILFRTLNVHEVRQARGDRITVSGFWGPRSDGNYQYWV